MAEHTFPIRIGHYYACSVNGLVAIPGRECNRPISMMIDRQPFGRKIQAPSPEDASYANVTAVSPNKCNQSSFHLTRTILVSFRATYVTVCSSTNLTEPGTTCW